MHTTVLLGTTAQPGVEPEPSVTTQLSPSGLLSGCAVVFGAEPGSCTLHLVLTKDLLRYLSLIGMFGLLGWIRTSAAVLRRDCSVHRPGESGGAGWNRTSIPRL